MTPEPGHWGDVIVGMYVRVPLTQGVWRVDDERDGWLRLVDREQRVATLPRPAPDAPVTIMSPTLSEARTVVRSVLGGTVVEPS